MNNISLINKLKNELESHSNTFNKLILQTYVRNTVMAEAADLWFYLRKYKRSF